MLNFRYESYLIKCLSEEMILFNDFESFSLNFNQYNLFKSDNDNCLEVKDRLIISSNCNLKKRFICQKGIKIMLFVF